MNFLRQPDSFCFTSGVGDIIIQLTGSEEFVDFSIRLGSVVVLPQERYYPDASRVVTISDVGELLSHWLREDKAIAFLLKRQETVLDFTFVYNATTKSHRVMRCDVDFDVTAAYFCGKAFLNLMFSSKETHVARRETLAFYSATAQPPVATVTASYLSGNAVVEEVFQRPLVGIGPVWYVDVSPRLFVKADRQLLFYTVEEEGRTMRYEIARTPFLQQTHFVYRNAFGIEDTFTCVGEAGSKGVYERYYATLNGSYKNFKRKNLREYSADTGVLSQAQAYCVDDMFSSEEIWLYDESGLIKEVVILDQKVERSSLPDEMPRFEFTYRLTQSNQRYKTVLPRNIFDATFDRSFN